LITSPYLPAGNTKSTFSGRIINISEFSFNGATLNSYETLRIVHESSTLMLACPAVLNVISAHDFRDHANRDAFSHAPPVSAILKTGTAAALEKCRELADLINDELEKTDSEDFVPTSDRVERPAYITITVKRSMASLDRL
jgi:hypothetical protein